MRQRYILLLLSVIAVVSACSTRKKPASTTPVVRTQPVQDTTKKVAEVEKEKTDTIKPAYTIGLIIPLQLADHFANDTVADSDPLVILSALPAVNFYQGALAAQDSSVKLPIRIQYKIFDSAVDSFEIARILNGIEIGKCDAVISMLPATYHSLFAKSSQKHKKPFILLQSSNNQVLNGNVNLMLSTPSNSTQIRLMASYLYKTYPNSQFVTVYREARKENDLSAFFASVIDSVSGNKGFCTQVNYGKVNWSGLQEKLVKQKRNILIIPTSDESYLSSLMTKMETVKNDYTFLIAGLPSWENFETIDPLKLQQFNAHFFNGLFIDQENARVQNFRKAFIDTYHSYPMSQAFEAYDIVMYLANNFIKHKEKIQLYKGDPNLEAPVSGFNFVETCNDCGKENQSLSILKYGDFKLIRVK